VHDDDEVDMNVISSTVVVGVSSAFAPATSTDAAAVAAANSLDSILLDAHHTTSTTITSSSSEDEASPQAPAQNAEEPHGVRIAMPIGTPDQRSRSGTRACSNHRVA
jgi:hypothetical protein